MDLNVSGIVRSVAIAGVGLPVALAISGSLGAITELVRASSVESVSKSESVVTKNSVRSELIKPCLSYLLAKNDSVLEEKSKTEINGYFGGDVNHRDVCKWTLK
tara:strand:+ start:2523 stop:2834 length:312 start_codon:yes stop_codon:yes gene_type:complete